MRPKLPQPLKSVCDIVAGNNRAVQRPDRCADYPIRFNTGFVERLVGTRLITYVGTTALHNEHDLSGKPFVKQTIFPLCSKNVDVLKRPV